MWVWQVECAGVEQEQDVSTSLAHKLVQWLPNAGLDWALGWVWLGGLMNRPGPCGPCFGGGARSLPTISRGAVTGG